MCFRWNAVALLSSLHTADHSKFIAFIFSGALGGSSSNLEQARGYTSLPLAALRPNVSAPGSRTLHTSRPMAAPVANRPLSPHLPLKKPQFSATFSISHRIFGVALGVAIISVPLATKFSLMFGVWEWTAASTIPISATVSSSGLCLNWLWVRLE
jgi:succinate dehydrogenase (ubiquinone) cytochrome b560 subunit